MRTLLPLLLVLICACATRNDSSSTGTDEPAPYRAVVDSARLSGILPKVRKETDEFKGTVLYFHRDAPRYINSRSDLQLLLLERPDSLGPSLVLRNIYVDDDWLFIDGIMVKVDTTVYEFSVAESPVTSLDREVVSGGIYEMFIQDLTAFPDGSEQPEDEDAMVNRALIKFQASQILRMLQDVRDGAGEVRIRCQGDNGNRDRTMTHSEKKRISDMLDLFEALGGDLSRFDDLI